MGPAQAQGVLRTAMDEASVPLCFLYIREEKYYLKRVICHLSILLGFISQNMGGVLRLKMREEGSG